MPDRHLIDVHVLLVRDGELLLTQRRGGEFDGEWHLPSGKLAAGDHVLDVAAREACEEVGVLIESARLSHVRTTHVGNSGPEPRFGAFYVAHRWIGEPANCEPDKCFAVQWFPLDDLPTALIPYPVAGFHAYRRGTPFSVFGWPTATPTSR